MHAFAAFVSFIWPGVGQLCQGRFTAFVRFQIVALGIILTMAAILTRSAFVSLSVSLKLGFWLLAIGYYCLSIFACYEAATFGEVDAPKKFDPAPARRAKPVFEEPPVPGVRAKSLYDEAPAAATDEAKAKLAAGIEQAIFAQPAQKKPPASAPKKPQ